MNLILTIVNVLMLVGAITFLILGRRNFLKARKEVDKKDN